MAGDEPGARREWTRAGAGRLQDKGSKLVDSRPVRTHRGRMDNAPSIPNRAGTKVGAAGRPRTPPDRGLVRGSPIRSTALSQSELEPKPAAAPQPPDRPSRHTLDRFPFC